MNHLMNVLCLTGFAMNLSSCILSYVSLKQTRDDAYRYLVIILVCELFLYVLYYLVVYVGMTNITVSFAGELVMYLLDYLFGAALFYLVQRSFYRILSVRFTMKKRIAHLCISFSMTVAYILVVVLLGRGWHRAEVILHTLTSAQLLVIGFLLVKYLARITHQGLSNTLKWWIVILAVLTPLKIVDESFPALAIDDWFGIQWPFLDLLLFSTNLVMFKFLIGGLLKPAPPVSPAMDTSIFVRHGLTEREIDVAELLADRRTYREIGAQLFISLPTVKSHANHIYDKLQLSTRGELLEMMAGLKK